MTNINLLLRVREANNRRKITFDGDRAVAINLVRPSARNRWKAGRVRSCIGLFNPERRDGKRTRRQHKRSNWSASVSPVRDTGPRRHDCCDGSAVRAAPRLRRCTDGPDRSETWVQSDQGAWPGYPSSNDSDNSGDHSMAHRRNSTARYRNSMVHRHNSTARSRNHSFAGRRSCLWFQAPFP